MNSDTPIRTRYIAVALLCMTAAFVLVKTGRDALYFQNRGLLDLPLAYLGILVGAGPIASFVLWLMRRLGPRQARVACPLIMAAVLVAFFPVATPGGGWINTLFFMLVPLAWGVLFSLSWLLAADLLEGRPPEVLARAYSQIGAASILGGVLGGLLARLLAARIEPATFLLWGVGGLLAAVISMAAAQRRFPPPTSIEGPRSARSEEFGTLDGLRLLRNPYCAALMGVAVLTALVGVLIEFQFYLVAATSDNTGQENASFFANFYIALNLAALLVQLQVMPRLQRAAGVQGSLLILPFALLGGAGLLLFASASAALRMGLRVTEGGLKSSIHRSNWEQAYLPVDRAKRSLAKLMIDGMGARLGEGIAAAMLFFWLTRIVGDRPLAGLDTSWVTWALVIGTVSWLVLTRRLRLALIPAAASEQRDEYRQDIPLPDT